MNLAFKSEDHMAETHFRLESGIGVIPAQRLKSPYDARCRECGGEPALALIPNPRRARARWKSRIICSRCERPWREVEERLKAFKGAKAKHVVDRLRAENTLAGQLDAIAVLRSIFEARPRECTLPRWRWELGVWRVFLGEGVGHAKHTCEVLKRLARDECVRDLITPSRVGDAVAHARDVVGAKARRPGSGVWLPMRSERRRAS